ncbi:hypothetical protein DPMN_118205, partial [Dreissena polymorpha]
GNKVIDHKNKCLQLHIESQSINSWIKLCEDFFSGSLARAFQPVQRYLKTYEGWENLTFNFELDEEHFMHCVKSSVDYLKSILNAIENDVSAADAEPDNDVCATPVSAGNSPQTIDTDDTLSAGQL